ADWLDGALFCVDCGCKLEIKEPESSAVICPTCNAETPKGKKFCMKCGSKLQQEEKHTDKCPECGTDWLDGALFCVDCGYKLEVKDPEPVPELAPVSEPLSELVSEPEPVHELAPVSEPVSEPEPAPELAPVSEPLSELVSEPEPVPELAPVSEPVSELEPVLEPKDGMVICPTCKVKNPQGKKFCLKCGSKLSVENNNSIVICPSCKAENPQGKKFCAKCGTALTPVSSKPATDKPVVRREVENNPPIAKAAPVKRAESKLLNSRIEPIMIDHEEERQSQKEVFDDSTNVKNNILKFMTFHQ
ncbi:MAG: zinc ribbon domain-containing protein, partial [Muribaculaceae bacterium]|nr:zinc ribbon domain-containing protein [Muribaculaceae bacterium]